MLHIQIEPILSEGSYISEGEQFLPILSEVFWSSEMSSVILAESRYLVPGDSAIVPRVTLTAYCLTTLGIGSTPLCVE